MAVAVSRDLTVQVLEDVNVVKLSDRQQALRAAIQKGEPKCLGVSQVMLGLMVMCYSIPLHFTETTEVVLLGVPWWSGLTFITAGVASIVLDKHGTMKTLRVCLLLSLVSAVLSFVAVIIYSVDMDRNPSLSCIKTMHNNCNEKYYATSLLRRFVPRELLQDLSPLQLIRIDLTDEKYLVSPKSVDIGLGAESTIKKMSRGVKSSLLLFTLAQMVISSVVCFLLFRQRRSLGQYTSLSQDGLSSPTSVSPPDLN